MKPFDLEAAKRGEPIVTRDGRKAKFVAHLPEVKDEFKVIVYIEGAWSVMSYCDDGVYCTNREDANDLFMSPPPMSSINGHEYPEPVSEHPDNAAVDAFAAVMKEKLAKKRADGRGGWQECSSEYLSNLLHEHVSKGDPVDVANLAMMLHQNGQRIEPVSVPSDDIE